MTVTDENGRRKDHWFATKEKADHCAAQANLASATLSDWVYTLNAQDSALLAMALKKAGNAQAVLNAVEAVGASVPKLAMPLDEAVRLCLADRAEAGRSGVYQDQLDWTFKTFQKAFHGVLCSAITSEHVRAWIRDVGGSADTRRGYLSRLRTLFSFCQLHGWTTSNPAKLVSMPERENRAPVILSAAECGSVLKAAKEIAPEMLGYFGLCLFAGLRPSEARQVQPEDIGKEYVRVFAKKTKKRRLVSIQPALRSCLKAGGVIPVPSNYRKLFRLVVKKSEVKWSNDVMRHSFVTYHNEVFGWQETVKQAGHSLAVMLEHYRALTTRQEAERFWKQKP